VALPYLLALSRLCNGQKMMDLRRSRRQTVCIKLVRTDKSATDVKYTHKGTRLLVQDRQPGVT